MAQLMVTARIAAPAPDLWALVGRFDKVADWHPLVTACEVQGHSRGAIRRLRLISGETLVERLEHAGEAERFCLYSVVEGPLPVTACVVELQVRERGASALAAWSANFTAVGAREVDAAMAVRRLLEAGAGGLERLFGRSPPPAEPEAKP